jgi:hypothetical protein
MFWSWTGQGSVAGLYWRWWNFSVLSQGIPLSSDNLKVDVFWVVTLYSVLLGYQRFGGPCCLWNVGVLIHHYTASQPRKPLNNFCRILTMVCWYWTNCTFGLCPSSGVSKKLRNKIYIPKNTHVQNSHKGQLLTTEPLTWVHTHINPWSKSDTGGNKWPSHCTLHSY